MTVSVLVPVTCVIALACILVQVQFNVLVRTHSWRDPSYRRLSPSSFWFRGHFCYICLLFFLWL